MNEGLDDFSKFYDKTSEHSKTADQIAALQDELQKTQDDAREERFLWVLIFVIFFDAIIFSGMGSWGGPLVIGVLQLVGLIALGRRWGVDDIALWADKALGRWNGDKDA